MKRQEAIEAIRSYAGLSNAFDMLEAKLEDISNEALSDSLLSCGIIPETYAHDSSEEKLWAKYCDILLSKAFCALGIRSSVLRTRGDSADVFGAVEDYTIVGDAKAFRLSRTAKNQKDFKVAALDDWRRGNTFACLISPLSQYPSGSSQIYYQAEERNVTLLSYVHLRFLLDHSVQASLRDLWEVPGSLKPAKEAGRYWEAIDEVIVALTGTDFARLKEYKHLETRITKEIGEEGISYWETIIESYWSLPQEEAVKRLIKAEKIEEKIRTIKTAISSRRTIL
jgi:type II restriction enzyme